MGSGASTDKKPLTEVRLKSEVGVLFDDKAKRAFDAAATEGADGTRTVPWPTIEATPRSTTNARSTRGNACFTT